MISNPTKEEKMRKRTWICLALIMVIPGLLLTVSCAKKAVQTEEVVEQPEEQPPAEEAQPEMDQQAEEAKRQAQMEEQQRLEEERLAAEQAQREAMMARNMFMSDDIHFDFDSAVLVPAAQEILQSKATWLQDNPDNTVIIEGHCDERGTNAYNLALGDRRAEAVKAFLEDLGIAASRMTTISYGEEKPVDPGHNEEAWAKNRRAHFVIE
jgi:peptidoglycan-associated lipoprotein